VPLATGLAAVLMGACITIDGKGYPFWTGSVAKTNCQAVTSGGDSGILVAVLDWGGRPLPGATVTASAVSSVETKSVQTGLDGHALERFPAGSWSLEASLPGFKSAKASVVADSGEVCTIRCFLVLGDGTGLVH
jgi:carboxypeptidase family protein